MTQAEKTAVVTADVKSFADRINRLEDEKETIGEDIKEIYLEAAGAGIDKKALKVAIRAKRREIDLGHKTVVNSYLEEMGELPLFSVSGS